MTRLYQFVRLLLTVGGFLFFYVGAVLLSWLLLPAWRLRGRTPAERSALSRRLVGRGFRLFHDYLRVMHLVRFDPRELAPHLPSGKLVVIANHPTLVDVTALMAAQVDLTCVVKGGLFRGPTLGRLLRYCWHIDSGASGGLTGGGGVISSGVRRLAAGVPVLIFPEGSRSPEGGLRGFKRGAFEIASLAEATVVPVFITCSPPLLAKEAPWYRVPPTVPRLRVMALPPMDPASWHGDSRAMANDAHAGYLRLLAGEDLGRWKPEKAEKAENPVR